MIAIIEKVYQFLWGDWIVLPLPGGSSFRFSLLVLILIPAGIWFTIRTRFLPIRLFPDMLHTLFEKKGKAEGESHNSTLSALQTLIVSTATRVGMGNLVGVVAAISAGGAGAVFWMWVTALIGSSRPLWKQLLHRSIKKKTRYMVATVVDRPIICTDSYRKSGEEKRNVMWEYPFSLQCPD